MLPIPGAKAPAFSLVASSGKTVTLSELTGKKIVLYFYPKDDTTACTAELRFKGGKGIATSAGVLAALVPWALIIIAAVWAVLFVGSGFVSLGSIAASAALPVASWLTGESLTMVLVTLGLAVLAIYKHRANIRRLLNGTEHRVRLRKEVVS